MSHVTSIVVENIIVIEVEVDELHEGKILSRPSTSMTISLVAGKQDKQAQLGVPHSRIQVELGFILQAGTCQILNFVQNPR